MEFFCAFLVGPSADVNARGIITRGRCVGPFGGLGPGLTAEHTNRDAHDLRPHGNITKNMVPKMIAM